MELPEVDAMFHLAAMTRPQESVSSPEITHRINVDGTFNMLMNCHKHKIKHFIFASSASVYGEQKRYPVKEKSSLNLMTPYALHKYIGEKYCRLFSDLYGVKTTCLRLFNVYGDGMNPYGEYSSLIPKFKRMAREGSQPTIYGTGEQKRDFVHVDDVVNAFIQATKVSGTFNIGSGKCYSVNEVFEMIFKNKNTEPLYGSPQIEPRKTLADLSLSRKVLKWEPTISLEEGLEKLT